MGWRDRAQVVDQPSTAAPSGGWRSRAISADASPDVIQEMPEDVSAADRLWVKNFSNSPASAVQYLKDQYPSYDIKHDPGLDQILMRAPGEKQYKVLDPNKPWAERLSDPIGAIKEGAMDLGDIGYDVASGLGTTAAAGLGAAGGLPTAAGAGALAGGGLEALRQKIGQALGMKQDVNKTDVEIAAAMGGLSPILFGAKMPFGSAEAEGYISRMAPKTLSLASGIPKTTVESAAENLNKIKAMEAQGSKAATNFADRYLGDVNVVKDAAKTEGKNIENMIGGFKGEIPLDAAKAPYLEEIAKLEAIPTRTVRQQQALDALKKAYSELLMPGGAEAESVSAPMAQSMKQTLVDEGNVGLGGVKTPAQNVATRSIGAMSAALKKAIPGLQESNPAYAKIMEYMEKLDPLMSNEEKVFTMIKSLKNKDLLPEILNAADEQLGTGFINKANLWDAFKTFRKSAPVKVAENTLKRKALSTSIGSTIGGVTGYETGGRSGALIGAGAGGLMGMAGGSPAGIRLMLEGLRAAPALRYLPMPVWNLIHNAQGE